MSCKYGCICGGNCLFCNRRNTRESYSGEAEDVARAAFIDEEVDPCYKKSWEDQYKKQEKEYYEQQRKKYFRSKRIKRSKRKRRKRNNRK